MIKDIIDAFQHFSEVEAILLGGSRATEQYDEKSDYDIYVYLNSPLTEDKRKKVLSKYCSTMEYSNNFWELEDDGILNSRIEIEMIYRDVNFFDEVIKNMRELSVGNGYTTCFYDNLMNSVILFDRSGKMRDMQANNKGLINDDFAQALIDKNYPLIYEASPALFGQIKKAMERQDFNSVNHRITEYFAIYYDILFVLNKRSHPGEKRLIKCANTLQYLPKDFETKVKNVLFNSYNNTDVSLQNLLILSKDLENLIIKQGYSI